MKKQPLVSVIIPVRNSGTLLENCLRSIKNQKYKNIEVLIIDGGSSDNTISLSGKYQAQLFIYKPKVKKGTFDAPHKRNYGVAKARGKYIYYVDADMELTKNIISEAVAACEKGADAIIVPEDSFGTGIWAKAKNLERRCYWGDNTVEAPRFIRRSVWVKLGGLDESLGGGGDDWDFHQKLINERHKVDRITSIVRHNEGDLKLSRLMKKRFMYGRDSLKYISKRPKEGAKSYFPFRASYFKNWKLFLVRPVDTIAFIIMRTAEYAAGISGAVFAIGMRK